MKRWYIVCSRQQELVRTEDESYAHTVAQAIGWADGISLVYSVDPRPGADGYGLPCLVAAYTPANMADPAADDRWKPRQFTPGHWDGCGCASCQCIAHGGEDMTAGPEDWYAPDSRPESFE